MKKPLWTLSTAMRLIALAIVAAAYILLCASLGGCAFLTAIGQATGLVSGGSAAQDAAKVVDDAVVGWIGSLFGSDVFKVSAGAAISESLRATGKVVKRRRAKARERREADKRVDDIINQKVT